MGLFDMKRNKCHLGRMKVYVDAQFEQNFRGRINMAMCLRRHKREKNISTEMSSGRENEWKTWKIGKKANWGESSDFIDDFEGLISKIYIDQTIHLMYCLIYVIGVNPSLESTCDLYTFQTFRMFSSWKHSKRTVQKTNGVRVVGYSLNFL